LNLDPEIKCYLPGVPRATYMPYPFQILHSASALTFVYEYAGAVRNIFLNDPGPAPADSWMGKSVGRISRPLFVRTPHAGRNAGLASSRLSATPPLGPRGRRAPALRPAAHPKLAAGGVTVRMIERVFAGSRS
jgi:hypothetical protein